MTAGRVTCWHHRYNFSSPVPRCRTVALSLLLLWETGVRVTASLVYVTPLLTSRGADTTLFSMRGWSRMNVSTLSGSFREESKPSSFRALFRHWVSVRGK